MKKISAVIISAICLFCFVGASIACEGARPLAMGGAFTGLADDANATYWNPAALGLMEKNELTYTGTIYDRDAFNYDDWFSMVLPLKPLSDKAGFDLGTTGFSFMNNLDKGNFSDLYYGININVATEISEQWYTFSYGRELAEVIKGLCVGVNLRGLIHKEKLKATATIGGSAYADNASDSDSLFAVDAALYYLWKKLSFGILLQNLNEPNLTLFGVKGKYGLNVRPGIAYRVMDKLTLSGELYDAFDHVNSRNVRLGAEVKPTDNIALRMGAYDFAATEKTGRAVTGGIGLLSGKLFAKAKIDLSYTAMYWYKSNADTKDKFTHMASISMKF